ncbi:conserved hypothetical protein [Leishmania major strain Friedlin]|uniref:Uncharacterized protein n=1 Tax=Leishmania major TaxID=5664 RepID=Q4QCI6_LEIMA|nr:conserved hypothetical protein [Leishmania major strain Friedlin]CAG9573285.1 hypothetical_protein_-_conserved [Leishmania major strain Friedlin]CAJ03873.1 conserved hypothetical protein [Leishmania major strain Friedlin]|eukprot:XP_001682962.1 conserved hypothetical protein [Leishmania major strain Friedlin]
MLSNTRGYQRFSHTLGFHSDDLSKLSKVCHQWRETGKCKAYNREQEVRREIAAAKEAELLKKATALYTMHMELMADMAGADGGDAEALELVQGAMSRGSFPTDPAKREEAIGKLVEELKQEPVYLNWSLDAAVAERLVELKVKRCPYNHRGDLNLALKRGRNEEDEEEMQHRSEEEVLRGSSTNGAAAASSSSAVAATTAAGPTKAAGDNSDGGWAAARHRIFRTLTPLQRCVVCLLWQRTFQVAQGLVMDVRLALEKRVTAQHKATGRVEPPSIPSSGVAAQSLSHRPHGGSQNDVKNADSEDALEAYLSSPDFEELVERETKRVVPRVAFRPEFGLVDLSALPQLVAHLSAHPTCGIFLARTLTYFTGKALKRDGSSPSAAPAAASSLSKHQSDDAPAPESFHHLLFPSRKRITEKELDLSTSTCADEVMEAIEWALHVYHRDAQSHAETERAEGKGELGMTGDERRLCKASDTASAHVTALFRHQRIRLHGLTLSHCQITSADGIVESLHKRHLEQYLYALDLSENRLWSLRFLLVLRAHYARRLLRLSLRNNPITRKPEYQEQVRASLPQLTSLDSEPIRRPPLRLPKPWPTSCTRWISDEGMPEHQEQESVLDCVARLLYIWETRRIPHTARELAAFRNADRPAPVEEALNEDNFPHRYLHPAAAFSVTVSPNLSFYDAATMRDARSVELDKGYTGMRLSAVDVRDARVFNVAMKNSSRNLLAGRQALQRFGRGAENCYMAYQLTLYPERMDVSHHLTDAVVSVARVPEVVTAAVSGGKAAASVATTTAASGKREKSAADPGVARAAGSRKTSSHGNPTSARFGALAHRSPPLQQHVVTLHGIMTWRLPSMKRNECLQASYTRVLTLTKKVLPDQNREWERLRSPPYVLMNDQVFLYPAPTAGAAVATAALLPSVFVANTATRLSRLVVEFGLEACRDGVALVRDVMERCTSPASEYAALQALVLGVLGPREETDEAEEAAQLACAQAAEAQLTPLFADYLRRSPPPATAQSREYTIFSMLDCAAATTPVEPAARTTGSTQHQSNVTSAVRRLKAPAIAAAPSAVHVVSLPLLHQVTAITNVCYTLSFH